MQKPKTKLQKVVNDTYVNSMYHTEHLANIRKDLDKLITSYEKKPIYYTAVGSALDDVIRQGKTEAITRRIVYKIAYSNKERYAGNACRQLVSNYYNEEIMKDIVNAVNYCFAEGLKNGGIWLDYNSTTAGIEIDVKYSTFEKQEGEKVVKKSYYSQFYNAIENAFYRFNGRKSLPKKEEGVIQLADGYKAYSTKEGIVMHAVYNTSNAYISSLKEEGSDDIINNVLVRADFISLMRWIKKQASKKKYSDYCIVINGLLQGMTSNEISNTYTISMGRVKHAREDLKVYYEKYKALGRSLEVKKQTSTRFSASKVSFMTTYCEDNTNSGKTSSCYDKKKAIADRSRKKEEAGSYTASWKRKKPQVITYSKYGVVSIEEMQEGRLVEVFHCPTTKDITRKAVLYHNIIREEAGSRKALKKLWKASRCITSKEEGRKAEEAYIIRQAWQEAIAENRRRQNAWEDYTRFLAFNVGKEATLEYKQEDGHVVVYEDGIAVRKYPIASK